MNFKEIFNDSFYFLKKNKILVIPFFLIQISLIILILLLVLRFDLVSYYKEEYKVTTQYNQYVQEQIKQKKIPLSLKNYASENKNLIKEKEKIKNLFSNLNNIKFLLISIISYIIIYFLLMNWGNYIISQKIKNAIIGNEALKRNYFFFNSIPYLFKYFILTILYLLILFLIFSIIYIPLIIIVFNPIIGLIIFLFTIILVIYLFIFIILRLFFVNLSIYLLDNLGIIETIKFCFKISKNKIKVIGIIALIIYGIISVGNSFGFNSIFRLFLEIITNNTIGNIIFSSILIIVFLIIVSFISYFVGIFSFITFIYILEEQNYNIKELLVKTTNNINN